MGNELLRAVLAEVGWRQETFARRITEYARVQGLRISVHEKTPYSWVRDGRCPHDPIPLLAAEVLSGQLGRNVCLADLGWAAASAGMMRADEGLTGLWLPSGAILGLQEVAPGVQRRHFLALTGSALTAAALQAVVADLPRLAATLEGGRRVDEHLVADLERLTVLRRRMDDELGGGAIYEAVTADLRLVTRIVANSSYPEAVGRRLYSVAAELARLAGYSCHDTGHEGAAQRYWLVALRAAGQAQDRALGANVLTFMGVQAMQVTGPADAATVFAAARHHGGAGIGARQRAAITSLGACAQGRAGQRTETERSIDDALTALAQARPEEDPDWIYWANTAELSGNAGAALLHLGDSAAAITHLETALTALDSACSRDRVMWLCTLASAQLRAGDADRAIRTGHEAVDIAVQLSADRMHNLLGDFCREATGTLGNRAAADLDDRARTTLQV